MYNPHKIKIIFTLFLAFYYKGSMEPKQGTLNLSHFKSEISIRWNCYFSLQHRATVATTE